MIPMKLGFFTAGKLPTVRFNSRSSFRTGFVLLLFPHSFFRKIGKHSVNEWWLPPILTFLDE